MSVPGGPCVPATRCNNCHKVHRAWSCDPTPLTAIEDALNSRHFDEIIISTLPARLSRWLRLDLPSKAAGFGIPVTTVTALERERAAV